MGDAYVGECGSRAADVHADRARSLQLTAPAMGASRDDMRCPRDDSGTQTDKTTNTESQIMRITMRYMTPFLGAAAAVVAISAAPVAGAATTILPNQESCTGVVCQSPGNVQINDASPAPAFYPYGGSAFLLGGGDGYFGGKGGGGGHGHGGHR